MNEILDCSECKHCCINTRKSYHYCKLKKRKLNFNERNWYGCYMDFEWQCFEKGECEVRH